MRVSILRAVAATAMVMSASANSHAADTTLQVMSWEQRIIRGNEYWDAVTKGFEAQHPGITIETNFVPINQYLTTLTSMAAGGTLPDVFFSHVKAAELGRAGRIIDFKQSTNEDFLNGFFSALIGQFTFDGAVRSLPWNGFVFGIYANDRILKELNLTPPETWEGLIAMAPTIRAAGLTPLAWGNHANSTCADFFLPLVAQYGANIRELDDLTKADVTWNSKPVVEALMLMQRLAKAGVFLAGINGVDQNTAWQVAYQGKAVMLFAPSNAPGDL